jgi:hypothetical protein
MGKTPAEVVRDFCAAWSRLDLDELLAYFTEDAVYCGCCACVWYTTGRRAAPRNLDPTEQRGQGEHLHPAAAGETRSVWGNLPRSVPEFA